MDVRQFIFFNNADEILFTRTDAESANWQVDELSLTCLFPYVPEKTILRGMRIAFEDDDGVLQPFEVRKVRNYEPDRYQEITCEHIVISELTDIHTGEQELTDASPSSALSSIISAQPDTITGAKRWAVGNVTATNTSSGDISMGSVWQNIRNIEANWNVYILPRVTWSASGITGRYLDIVPASGVWHGLRLSIDKNADELGVTVDDTEVKTALYGYGGNSYTYKTDNLDKDKTPINLIGYTWPGKPSGASINSTAGYIEDTAATAMYGRNGVPRFGFFQNGDISDQATLAQKTWEALQTTNKPIVTVDCMVRDLYRMGYHDEQIRLHDTVLVELLPMNDVLQLEIIKLAVDLLDPTATRPTIGEYIPNIVYIQRQTAETASGGAGRGISGRRGGETESEAKWSEFQAEFVVNNAIMSYHAVQVDHDNKVLKAAGMDIDATTGAIIYATDNKAMIGSKFNVHSDQISLVVSTTTDPQTQTNTYKVNAASIVAGINNDTGTGQSYVSLDADRIMLSATDGITLGDMITIDGSSFMLDEDMTFQCDNIICATNLEVGSGVSETGSLYAYSGTISHFGTEEFTYYVGTSEYTPQDLKIADSTSSSIAKVLASTSSDVIIPDAVSDLQIVAPAQGSNNYTLQKKTYSNDSWTDVGTFSRATTLSGEWSSGVFTTTATPQGDELKTSLTNTGHWGNPSVTAGEDVNTYYYATKATIGNSATIYDTGNTTTISGLGRYNAGKTDGIAIGEGNVRITSVDGTDYGDPSYNVNPASITATASNGATYTRSLYLTQGSWNSNNQKAVNIRVGTTSGNLIGRIWINAPSVSVGKPYLNQPAQGKIRAICVVNGQTYYGDTHNLSEYS